MIHITGDYYLDSDDRQYILIKKRKYIAKKNGEEKEGQTILGYYTSIVRAINALVGKQFKQEMGNSTLELNEAINRLQTLQNSYTDLLYKLTGESKD